MARPSFAGTGLLERMRSTTFALLGITAAMGLGLVAVVSQQGWPLLPGAPIPGLSKPAQVHDAAAVATRHAPPAPLRSAGVGAGGPAADRGGPAPETGASRLSGSRTLDAAPPQPAPEADAGAPADQGPPSEPVAGEPPPSESPAPAPAAGPAPAPAAPPASTAPSPPQPAAVSASTGPKQDVSRASVKHKSSAGWKGGKSEKSDGPGYSNLPAPPAPVAQPDEYGDEEKAESAEDASSTYRGKGRGHAYGHSDR